MINPRLATKNSTKEERAAIDAEWAAAYPDQKERTKARAAEHNRKYREENKAKLAERDRKYYEENKAKVAEKYRKYREENKAKLAEYRRKYREENKAKIAEKDRKYYEENKAKVAEQHRKYKRKRYATDPAYRVVKKASGGTLRAINSQSTSKTTSTAKMLGCSGKYAAEYLNNLPHSREMGYTVMTPGVHIDHIKPKAAFDLSDPEQQLQFNHYTNLQLLGATENIRKGSFYAGKRHCHKKAG
jgi:hypothetical protein